MWNKGLKALIWQQSHANATKKLTQKYTYQREAPGYVKEIWILAETEMPNFFRKKSCLPIVIRFIQTKMFFGL